MITTLSMARNCTSPTPISMLRVQQRRRGTLRRTGSSRSRKNARHDAEREAEVADAVGDERLDRRVVGAALLVPEADQQIRCDAHPFPAEEQLQEVVRRHQREHREGEEREIGEEPRPVRVFVPCSRSNRRAPGTRDRVHHHQHDRGQRIDADAPGGGKASRTSINRKSSMTFARAHRPRRSRMKIGHESSAARSAMPIEAGRDRHGDVLSPM